MTVKPRFWLFVIVVICVVALVAGTVASNSIKKPVAHPTPTPNPNPTAIITPPPTIASVTVASQVGISSVKITTAGNSIIKNAQALPFTFNCKPGDTVQFTVTTQSDYIFNAWSFNDGTFNNHNPLVLKV